MISIVDDDPDIIMLFHEALKSISGITIFTFTDPILALEHFQVMSTPMCWYYPILRCLD